MKSNYQSKLISAVVKSMTESDREEPRPRPATTDEERDKLIREQFDLIRDQRKLIGEQADKIASLMAELESFRKGKRW